MFSCPQGLGKESGGGGAQGRRPMVVVCPQTSKALPVPLKVLCHLGRGRPLPIVARKRLRGQGTHTSQSSLRLSSFERRDNRGMEQSRGEAPAALAYILSFQPHQHPGTHIPEESASACPEEPALPQTHGRHAVETGPVDGVAAAAGKNLPSRGQSFLSVERAGSSAWTFCPSETWHAGWLWDLGVGGAWQRGGASHPRAKSAFSPLATPRESPPATLSHTRESCDKLMGRDTLIPRISLDHVLSARCHDAGWRPTGVHEA